MSYTTDNRYAAGASGAVAPDDAPAAYSARWIDHGTWADVLPDRQGFAYDVDNDGREKLGSLLQQANVHRSGLLAEVGYDEPEMLAAAPTEGWEMWVRRSGGYFYVDAWLTPAVVEDFSDLDLDLDVEERTFTFSITGTFTAATQQEAFDEWVDALRDPTFVEDGTGVEVEDDDIEPGSPLGKLLAKVEGWDVKLLRPVPADWPVQPLPVGAPMTEDVATCGECGRSWDDGVSTSMTPAPSGRCPFEYFHDAVLPDRCVHCGKAVHREMHDGHVFIIDDATGGDVCGTWGTFTNEPHVTG